MTMFLDQKRISLYKLLLKRSWKITKKLTKEKAQLPFNISDVADTEAVDCNNDTNINVFSKKKGAQIKLLKSTEI